MRLVNYLHGKKSRIGALIDGSVVDLQAACRSWLQSMEGQKFRTSAGKLIPTDMLAFLTSGESAWEAARASLSHFLEHRDDPTGFPRISIPLQRAKLLAPVPRPGKIICIGLNYPGGPDIQAPAYPVVFLKAASSVIGSEKPIVLPSISQEVVYEAELAVVIGSKAKNLSKETALSCVAGYTLANDVGARDLERRTSQWTTGKLMDSFCPLGPALVSRDEIPDPGVLPIQTRLNGQIVQAGNTRDMIFSVPDLVSYLSQLTTLEPGDVILTGSPKMMQGRPVSAIPLQPGDRVEVEIGTLGILSNPVGAERTETGAS